MFRGLSVASLQTPKARRALSGLRILRDIPYLRTGMAEHTLDLYMPVDAGAQTPVMFYIHGGGFRILSKDTHWLMGVAFAQQGFITVNVNYRLAPRHPYPAAIDDVFAAYLWTLRHIAQYGGDPDRIVVAGESAGANLACGLTLAACTPLDHAPAQAVFETAKVPNALLANCGMLQVSDPQRFQRRKALPVWIYDRIEEVSTEYLASTRDTLLADPLLVLEHMSLERSLPATFASVGTKDPLLDDTRRLEAALTARNADIVAKYYEGEVHAFHAFVWRRNAVQCWKDQFHFLAERGLLTASST
ncbi:MAG: alpha/beta hydrolase [bacterium]